MASTGPVGPIRSRVAAALVVVGAWIVPASAEALEPVLDKPGGDPIVLGQDRPETLRDPAGIAMRDGKVYVSDNRTDTVKVFNAAGEFQSEIGEAGSTNSPETIKSIGPVAVDGAGNVYVADASESEILKYNSAGVRQYTIGGQGDEEGKFFRIGAIAAEGSRLYVAEKLNRRVQQFNSSNGTFLRTWGWGVSDGTGVFQVCTSGCQEGVSGSGDGQMDDPVGIVADAFDVYVLDRRGNPLQRFDSATGAFEASLIPAGTEEGSLNLPVAITYDSSIDRFLIGQQSEVHIFTKAGVWESSFGTFGVDLGEINGVQGLASDSNSRVHVWDGSGILGTARVQIFKTEGPFSGTYGTGGEDELYRASAVSVVGKQVFVADLAGALTEFSSAGEFKKVMLDEPGQGLDATGSGVFFTDLSNVGRRFDLAGNQLAEFPVLGTPSSRIAASDQNESFVVGSGKVQRFDPDGNLITEFSGVPGENPSFLRVPVGIATDSDGNLKVIEEEEQRILSFGQDGALLDVDPVPGLFCLGICGLDVSPTGDLFVVGANELWVFGPDGSVKESGDATDLWEGLSIPSDVAHTPDGHMLVSDLGAGIVVRLADPARPTVQISARKNQKYKGVRAQIGCGPWGCTSKVTGKVTAKGGGQPKKTYKSKTARPTTKVDSTKKVRVRFSKKVERKIKQALARGAKVKLVIKVEMTNQHGKRIKSKTVKLK